MTQATAGKVVKIDYTLTIDGQVIDSSVGGEPLAYNHGENEIIRGLEEALEGMRIGDSKNVTIPPEKAYGLVNQEALIEVSKEEIPPEAHEVGAQLVSDDENGVTLRPVVAEVREETLILDFNHPLAGKTLVFDVKVVDVA